MRLLVFFGLAVLAIPLPDRPATAGSQPSSFYSTIPATVATCPAGDLEFRISLRDFMNRPLTDTSVYFMLRDCPTLAPVIGNEGYTVHPYQEYLYVTTWTDPFAQVTFSLRAGGTCPAPGVWLYAGGVSLTRRPVASTDQDGNFGVGANDVALAQAKLGGADPTADFDGDGAVTATDLDILRGHLGHHAPGMATPVAPRSWGAIKQLYR